MTTFDKITINNIVNKLINGQDYRAEIVHRIDREFFNFTLDFFKKIVKAKINEKTINLNWYKANFILNKELTIDDIITFAGTNKKTITNIKGSAKREVVLDFAQNNFDYLSTMIKQLEDDDQQNLNLTLLISYKEVAVNLSLTESLLVINVLATKKLTIRGGAWSSLGKKVEKALMLKLCQLAKVPSQFINPEVFTKNKELNFDREIDFKLYSRTKSEYRVEVKLMGQGNPESADAVIARDSHIFIADTLSEQNKNQLTALGIEWLELRNNSHIMQDFIEILKKLIIPFNED